MLHILLSLVYFQSILGESNGPTAELCSDVTTGVTGANTVTPCGDLLGDQADAWPSGLLDPSFEGFFLLSPSMLHILLSLVSFQSV